MIYTSCIYKFQYRHSGEQASTDEILKIVRRFSDDLTIDNCNRAQLMNLCRYMGIPPIGTDALLMVQLRRRMRDIKKDDRVDGCHVCVTQLSDLAIDDTNRRSRFTDGR